MKTWRHNYKSYKITKKTPEYVYNKLADAENRSRMQPTDGWFAKRNYETWEQCEDEFILFLRKSLTSKTLTKREHICQKQRTTATNQKSIACKPLPNKQKREVLKNVRKLKGSNIFVNKYFCFETIQCRKELREKVKQLKSFR